MKKIFRSRIFWAFLILIIAIRLLVPPMIKPQVNELLATFSPTFKGHVNDVGISFFRGAFQLRDLELTLKDKSQEKFFTANVIDTSIAWRDIFRGRITSDVLIDKTNIALTKNVLEAFKKTPKEEQEKTKKEASKLFPLTVERVDIRDSSFEFADLASVPEASRWKVTDIDGRLSNATPAPKFPLTMMTLDGKMFDSAEIKVAGQLNQLSKPTAWDVDLEIRGFDLRQANPVIAQKLPLSFTSGKLDAYSEIKSEDNKIVGYVKPFIQNADVIASNESFRSAKNFGLEVSTAAVNLLLRDAQKKTLATKVLFSYEDGDFKINSMEALAKAIQNGFAENVPKGIEDQISLSSKQTKTSTTTAKGEKK